MKERKEIICANKDCKKTFEVEMEELEKDPIAKCPFCGKDQDTLIDFENNAD